MGKRRQRRGTVNSKDHDRGANSPARSSRRWWLAVAAIAIAVGFARLFLGQPTATEGEGIQRQAITRSISEAPRNTLQHPKPRATKTDGSQEDHAAGWSAIDNPSGDGWNTEEFAERAKQQLERIGSLLDVQSKIDESTIGTIVDENFQCAGLAPEQTEVVYEGGGFRVVRDVEASSDSAPNSKNDRSSTVRGTAELVRCVRDLAKRFPGAEEFRFHAKVVDVQLEAETAATTQLVAISAETERGLVEMHASWSATWKRLPHKHPPQLTSLTVASFEETAYQSPARTLLTDCTKSVLAGSSSGESIATVGYGELLSQLSHDFRLDSSVGYPALAAGDVNGDELDDLYVCQSLGRPNLLLLQQQDGSVRNAARAWKVDWLHESRSALLVDLDNDGDQDLAVAVDGVLVVAGNDGDHFEVRSAYPAPDDTTSLAAADFDQDGRLDLYLCAYQDHSSLADDRRDAPANAAGAFVYHDSRQGGRNILFRNAGNWRFEDVTAATGLEVNNARHSYAASWEDFDNDGDLDLYVANDYGPNCLYRNDASEGNGSHFTEIAESVNAQDRASGMSSGWGDYDGDGDLDLYVGNMFSSAGSRIATQSAFRPSSTPALRQTLQRFARGNTLLQNRGDGGFDDVSVAAGVTMGRWAWSSNFVDLNNDGWEDLLIANGMITGADSGDL